MATILSVDDELNPLILRKMLLEKAGHRVISASSGAEALRLLEYVKPDLLLTDQVMPVMTGIQLAQIVKARHPGLPIMIITGLNDRPAGFEIADAFISKLGGSANLLLHVENILQGGPESGDEEHPSDPDGNGHA